MAVDVSMYPSGLAEILKGNIDFDNDTIKVMLLDDGAVFDNTHTQLGDVSGIESVGTGYVSGGKALTNASVSVVGLSAQIDFDDVVWSGSTITAFGAVVYDDSVDEDPLLVFVDFGGQQSSSSGDFTITLDSTGLLVLTQDG